MTNSKFATKPDPTAKKPETVKKETYKKYASDVQWVPFDFKETQNLSGQNQLLTGVAIDKGFYGVSEKTGNGYIRFKILTHINETDRHKGIQVLMFEKFNRDPLTFEFIKKLIEEDRLEGANFGIRGEIDQQKYQLRNPNGEYELDDDGQRKEVTVLTTRPKYLGDILPLNPAEWPERDEALGTKVIDPVTNKMSFSKLKKTYKKKETKNFKKDIFGD